MTAHVDTAKGVVKGSTKNVAGTISTHRIALNGSKSDIKVRKLRPVTASAIRPAALPKPNTQTNNSLSKRQSMPRGGGP